MDFRTEYFRLQFAAAVHFHDFTGYEIDSLICELLTNGAYNYAAACKEGDYSAAWLAIEGTLSYVNTELDEEGYEAYREGFTACISLALEGHYDEDIDFENGLFPDEEEEAA